MRLVCVEGKTTFALLRFFVGGMFLAESAILAELDPVGVVLLILKGVVIALFTFRAGKRYLDAVALSFRAHFFLRSSNVRQR